MNILNRFHSFFLDPDLFEGDMELTPEQQVAIDLKIKGVDASTFGSSTHPSWPKVIPYEIQGYLGKYTQFMMAAYFLWDHKSS